MTVHCDDFTPAYPISPLVLIGVCASGKSTLAQELEVLGVKARAVAQEHSQVHDLYRRSGHWVVVLVANWDTVHRRRQLSWDLDFYRAEWERISDARKAAALIVHTDWLSPVDVAARVTTWFDRQFGFDQLWAQLAPLDHQEMASIRARYRSP